MQSNRQANKFTTIILLCILLLATGLRLWGIGSESYWLDEAVSIKQAQGNYTTTLELVKRDIHLPLYVSILHVWVHLFGTSAPATRSLSVLFGVASIYVCFLVGRRLFSRAAGLMAALVLAVSPIMIYYSQETRLYSLFVLLAMSSFLFFIRYVEGRKRGDLVAYGLVSLLLIYTHLFGFLVLVVQNLFVVWSMRANLRPTKRKAGRLAHEASGVHGPAWWFAVQGGLLLCFLPWLPTLIAQAQQTAYTSWIPRPDFAIVLKTLVDLCGNAVSLVVVLATIALVILLCWRTEKKRWLALLVLWICIPFGCVLAYSLIFPPLFHTRYLLFILPAFVLLFAAGAQRHRDRHPLASVALMILIVASSLLSVSHQVETTDKDDWRAVAAYLALETRAEDFIMIDPFYHQEPYAYYADPDCFTKRYVETCMYDKHRVVSVSLNSTCCDSTTRMTATDNRDRLQAYVVHPLWLVEVRSGLSESNESLRDYFGQRKTLILTKAFGDVRISKYR